MTAGRGAVSLAWAPRLGMGALYGLCLSAFLAPAAAEVATLLLVLAFFAALRRESLAWREPVLAVALFGAGYGILHTLLWSQARPEWRSLYWEGLGDWLRLLLFLPVAFFSRGDERRLGRLLLLLLVGGLLGMARQADWSLLRQGLDAWAARRPGFGLPALMFALVSAVGLLGLLSVGWRLLDGSRTGPRAWLAGAFWAVAVGCLGLGLGLTAARSGWLALAGAVPVSLWVWWCQRPLRQGSGRAPVRSGTAVWRRVVLVLALGALAAFASQWTLERAGREWSSAPQAPPTSNYLRRAALEFGIEKWRQRPLLGWGAESSGALIAESGRDDLLFREGIWVRHLHNTYLEILVQFGLFGLLISAGCLFFLARGLQVACREGRLSYDYCSFFAGVLVLVLIWSLFDYRLPHRDGRVFWMLLAGFAYGVVLRSPGGRPALWQGSGQA